MRFLANLPIEVVREKEWVDFAKKVLKGVPELTIMEMTLP